MGQNSRVLGRVLNCFFLDFSITRNDTLMLVEPSLHFSGHNYSFMTTNVPESHQNPRLQAKFETYGLNNFSTLPAIYFNLLQFLKSLLLHFVIFKVVASL